MLHFILLFLYTLLHRPKIRFERLCQDGAIKPAANLMQEEHKENNAGKEDGERWLFSATRESFLFFDGWMFRSIGASMKGGEACVVWLSFHYSLLSISSVSEGDEPFICGG